MNIKDFVSGHYAQQYKYKSFSPEKINHTWHWDDSKINVLFEEAIRKIGELNAFSMIVPDIDLFIKMHKMKEANASSRIEGTKTSIDEDLMKKEDVSPEKRDDWQEVQNYIRAMNRAIEELEKLPLSNRLLKKTHAVLLEGVRGEHKSPGNFRKSQNWIGGSNLSDAIYIPPHQDEVSELMSDLEKFLHNEEIEVPYLIKAAIAHYQFETIHPFLDGNGRIGRLLITLYLVDKKILIKPSLFLSVFFDKHRSSYYGALSLVRERNNMGHWIKFFLNGIIDASNISISIFKNILSLRTEVESKILRLGKKAENAKKLIQYMYSNPILNIGQTAEVLDLSFKSAAGLLTDLENLGILKETTETQRYKLFIFEDYLNLFK